jgi:hypothetical protein
MLKKHLYWIYAAIWSIAALLGWFVAVPSWISPVTFGWLNAAAVALAATLAATIHSGHPTRSVAHLIYDTEHETGSAR